MIHWYQTREEWLAARRLCRAVGASDVPILMEGVHFSRTEWDLFCALHPDGQAPEVTETALMRRGTAVEPVILAWARERLGLADQHGIPVAEADGLRASPDHLGLDGDGHHVIIEAKAVAPWSLAAWAPDGARMEGPMGSEGQTYPCPPGYLWQLAAQAAAVYACTSEVPRAHFAVAAVEDAVLGGLILSGYERPVAVLDLRLIEVAFDRDDLRRLLSVVNAWHARHVVAGEAPDTLDGSAACRGWLVRTRVPRTRVEVAGIDADAALTAAFDARAEARAAADRQAVAEARALSHLPGDAKTLRGSAGKLTISSNGRVTWTAAKDAP